MDNVKTPEQNQPAGKKEIRKQLADKIAMAIFELETTLGEKKFQHRIKKAVKLITEGLHKKETAKIVKKVKSIKKAASPKKAMSKKAAKKAATAL